MLVDVKCPYCKAEMQFDNSRETVFCPYCGGKVANAATKPQNQNSQPNIFITYTTNNSAVRMVTRIVSTGEKASYVNGQTLSYHLNPGKQTIVLKIGKINYNKDIDVPTDNTPVRINASFNGKAQITVDPPTALIDNSQTKTNANNTQSSPARTTTTSSSSNNNTVLFILLGIFVTAMMFISLGVLAKNSESSSSRGIIDNKYNLYLDITSKNNLILSTYDITISLDGKELGSVSDGKEFTYLVEVEKGEHELLFCKSGKSSPKATKKITVSNDMTYSCVLSHESLSIKIKDEKMVDNIDGSELEVVDVTGIPLTDALEKLNAIGFTNIREEPYSDIWEKANWIVSTQNVAPGSHIDKNEFIQLNCINGSDYFDPIFIGKNIYECQEIAKGAWYNLKFEDSSLHLIDVSSMSESEKKTWVAKSASYGSAYKSVYIIVENSGTQKVSTPTVASTITPKPTVTTSTKPTSIPKVNNTTSTSETTSSDTTKPSSVKVLSSKTTTYHNKDGSSSVMYYEYDAMGNIKKECNRNEYGINIASTEYEYDSWRRVTKITYNGSSSSDSWWKTYKYDDKGNVIEWESYYSSGRNKYNYGSYSLEYDENDRLIKRKSDGKYGGSGWEEYEYDDSGNLIKETAYELNSSIKSMHKYEYDKSGNMIKALYYEKESKLEYYYEYEYDSENKLLKETKYDNNGKVTDWIKYEYDEKGCEIKRSYNNGSWAESEYNYK